MHRYIVGGTSYRACMADTIIRIHIPEVIHLSYLNIFQEQMPGNIFLQEELLNHAWNNLPQEVVCAASVYDFKKLIDQYSSNTMYKCM